MMCYRDRTFCNFWNDCSKGSSCSKALTPEVQAAAEKWWTGSNPPIATYVEKPPCFFEGEENPKQTTPTPPACTTCEFNTKPAPKDAQS